MEMDLMIFILNSLINVCLVFAVWRLKRELFINNTIWRLKVDRYLQNILIKPFRIPELKRLNGKIDKMYIDSKIAEKFAERAFNMASAANLGVVALQKTLAQPRIMTKHQGLRNELAKDEVDRLFTTEGSFDFLRPILSDEENALLDEMEQHKLKNGSI